jgi:hypothetical protein
LAGDRKHSRPLSPSSLCARLYRRSLPSSLPSHPNRRCLRHPAAAGVDEKLISRQARAVGCRPKNSPPGLTLLASHGHSHTRREHTHAGSKHHNTQRGVQDSRATQARARSNSFAHSFGCCLTAVPSLVGHLSVAPSAPGLLALLGQRLDAHCRKQGNAATDEPSFDCSTLDALDLNLRTFSCGVRAGVRVGMG